MAFYTRGGAGGDGMSAYLEAQKKRGKKRAPGKSSRASPMT